MSNKEINNLICGFDIKRAHISQIEQSSIAQISLCKFDLCRYETTPTYTIRQIKFVVA